MKKKILVINPLLQHSHRLASALYESDRLQYLICGTPLKSRGEKKLMLERLTNKKMRETSIPSNKLVHYVLFSFLFKISQKFGSKALKNDLKHFMWHVFDYCISKTIRFYKPDIVVCYENSADYTFKEAKKIGAVCILDAASLHYNFKSKYITEQSLGYINFTNKKKDKEILNADYIITCSQLAKDSYIANGVVDSKVRVAHLGGCSTKINIKRNTVKSKPCKSFVYAGSVRSLKGVDLLLEAFERLESEGSNCKLNVYGSCDDGLLKVKMNTLKNVHYFGAVSNEELISELGNNDCIILPSRFDSFGMVVAESMAMGTPAIVSMNAGAKEVIDIFPLSGWIVQPSAHEIYQSIKAFTNDELVFDRNELELASQYCSWESYNIRINRVFDEIIK